MKRGLSLAFDFVFVYMYLRRHLSEGGYCTQSRRVPVPGSWLLITHLPQQLVKGYDNETKNSMKIFRKFEVALDPLLLIFFKLCQSYISPCLSKFGNKVGSLS